MPDCGCMLPSNRQSLRTVAFNIGQAEGAWRSIPFEARAAQLAFRAADPLLALAVGADDLITVRALDPGGSQVCALRWESG